MRGQQFIYTSIYTFFNRSLSIIRGVTNTMRDGMRSNLFLIYGNVLKTLDDLCALVYFSLSFYEWALGVEHAHQFCQRSSRSADCSDALAVRRFAVTHNNHNMCGCECECWFGKQSRGMQTPSPESPHMPYSGCMFGLAISVRVRCVFGANGPWIKARFVWLLVGALAGFYGLLPFTMCQLKCACVFNIRWQLSTRSSALIGQTCPIAVPYGRFKCWCT